MFTHVKYCLFIEVRINTNLNVSGGCILFIIITEDVYKAFENPIFFILENLFSDMIA